VAGVEYRYELRGGDEVVATCHLSREQLVEVGDRIEFGGRPAIVRAIEPLLRESELRLVLGGGFACRRDPRATLRKRPRSLEGSVVAP
jgi:hypothetical protein